MKTLSKFVCATLIMHSSTAYSQPAIQQAQALFNEGLKEAKSENYSKACPLFDESFRLDPLLSTLYFRGRCLDKAGKLLAAYKRYADYIELYDKTPPGQRLQAHKESYERVKSRRSAMEAEISKISIVLTAPLPGGARVFMDGEEISPASIQTPIMAEIGEHILRVEVPGKAPQEIAFRVELGEQKEIPLVINRPEAEPIPAQKPIPSKQPPSKAVVNKPAPKKEEAPPEGISGYRIGMYTALGIGGLGLVAGGITGGLVLGKKQAYDAGCKDGVCDSLGKAAWNEAKPLATASEISFGVGALGLLTAGALWWLGPTPERKPLQGEKGVRVGILPGCMGGMGACMWGVWSL